MSHIRATRKELFYEVTRALCTTCLRRVEAKVMIADDAVWLDKWCPDHGRQRVLIADDPAYWRMARERWLKPGELPKHFTSEMHWGCPYDCGTCPDHQQHACVTVVDLTDQCNLSCPICYAASGPHRPGFRSLAEIERMLDAAVFAEGAPDVVQLAGGEPTLHPELFAVLDACKARPIRHVMLDTNGIKLATDPALAQRLATYQPGFEVYLQLDSFDDEVLMTLRGARLSEVRRRAMDHLEAAGVSTTWVVTLARGVNDHEIGALVEQAQRYRCVRGVTLQPVQQAGRTDGYDAASQRLTLTEVRRKLLEQVPWLAPDDVVPVPCHPDALAMAYGLKHGGTVTPLTGFIDRETMLEGPASTIVFERIPAAKQAVVDLFSTALSPEGRATRLGELMCCLPLLQVPALTYEHVFRLLIVKFADAHDLETRSLKKSCIMFAQPDGRMIPFEAYNLLYRGDGTALADGRRRAESGG